MQRETTGNFGAFVRWKRLSSGKKLREFAAMAKLSPKRLTSIEKMAKPDVNEGTLYNLAEACGMEFGVFNRTWETTRVPVPKFRGNGGRVTITIPKDTAEKLAHRAGRYYAAKYIATPTIEAVVVWLADSEAKVIATESEPATQYNADKTKAGRKGKRPNAA